jgi:hypothetical protein
VSNDTCKQNAPQGFVTRCEKQPFNLPKEQRTTTLFRKNEFLDQIQICACWQVQEQTYSFPPQSRTNTLNINVIRRGRTNHGRQVAVATKFCTVTPSVYESSVWNLLHVTFMAPTILTWKVVLSIPDGVAGIFQRLNSSGRIVALGSTQPLTEMSARNPSWG